MERQRKKQRCRKSGREGTHQMRASLYAGFGEGNSTSVPLHLKFCIDRGSTILQTIDLDQLKLTAKPTIFTWIE